MTTKFNLGDAVDFLIKENVFGLTEKEWNDYFFGSNLLPPGRKQEIQAKIDARTREIREKTERVKKMEQDKASKMSNIENTNFVIKKNEYGLTEKEWDDYIFGTILPSRKRERGKDSRIRKIWENGKALQV
jgi:hypothetical protein